MKIYVVGSHKNKFFKTDAIRQKFFIDEKHSGKNLDFMNPWLCEMSGLYHLWKNSSDDIIGLEHYRRFLTVDKRNPIGEKEIQERLKNADIICNQNWYPKNRRIISWFYGTRKDIDLMRFLSFVKVYVGDDYYNACVKHLQGSWHCLGNMFIAKRETINEYCEFIFDVTMKFVEAEKFYGRNLSPRILGYFTEFLFGAWLEWKNKKIHFVKMRFVK